MKQYCRYCANCVLVDDDVCYCEESRITFSGARAKNTNQCKDFVFNEIDVFNLDHKYKPIESRKANRMSTDEQISLFKEAKNNG